MTSDEFRARIADLSIWKRSGQRAPHKPLLLLWALGRLTRGEPRLVPYSTVDAELKPLLQEFGPPRKSYHTEYPFWYLRNDGLWEVTGVEGARVREGKASEPTKRELVRLDAEGGLTADTWELLKANPALVRDAAVTLTMQTDPARAPEDTSETSASTGETSAALKKNSPTIESAPSIRIRDIHTLPHGRLARSDTSSRQLISCTQTVAVGKPKSDTHREDRSRCHQPFTA